MARYHQTTDPSGTPVMKPCRASVRSCPFGGDEIHHEFHDYQAASYWNEAARYVKDGIYMGGLQDAAASGEIVTERDYETAMEQAFKFQKDLKKRGEDAILDPKNKYFLVNNAPADQLHTLLEKSKEITFDDMAVLNRRLQLMPDGPDKNALQTELVLMADNSSVWRYQDENDFVYDMTHLTNNYDPVYQNNVGESYRFNRKTLQKILDDAKDNPDPRVQEALSATKKGIDFDKGIADQQHRQIIEDKQKEKERLHFVYSSVDADGNHHEYVSPISATGAIDPNVTPPAPSGGHRTAPPASPAPAPAGGHRTAPPAPPAPAPAGGHRTAPPAPSPDRRTRPDWAFATAQAQDMMDQSTNFLSSAASTYNEAQAWLNSYNSDLDRHNRRVSDATVNLRRAEQRRDRTMTALYGTTERSRTFGGRMRERSHLVRSMFSHPRQTMNGLRSLRNERERVSIARNRLEDVSDLRSDFIRHNKDKFTNERFAVNNLQRIMESLQENRTRLDAATKALNAGLPVPIQFRSATGGGAWTDHTDDPQRIGSYLNSLRRNLRDAYAQFSTVQRARHQF